MAGQSHGRPTHYQVGECKYACMVVHGMWGHGEGIEDNICHGHQGGVRDHCSGHKR